MKKAEYGHKPIKNEKTGKEKTLQEKLKDVLPNWKSASKKQVVGYIDDNGTIEIEGKIYQLLPAEPTIETNGNWKYEVKLVSEDPMQSFIKNIENVRKGKVNFPDTVPLLLQIQLLQSESNEEAIGFIKNYLNEK